MTAANEYPPSGWYWAEGDPLNTKRYWDGAMWATEARVVPTVTEIREHRTEIRNEQLRRANVRAGEGVPFHELYMRTRRRKGNWK